LKKFGIFEQKMGFCPPPKFFFILPPSKISFGYALDWGRIADTVTKANQYSKKLRSEKTEINTLV